MIISLIAAMDKNRVIGKNNQLPWHLPADLQHFKKLTLNKAIVMGRNTYDSIGKPLPERRNIIISRQKNLTLAECEVFPSLSSALNTLSTEKEIMVIGGASIFEQALPFAHRMYLTIINATVDGDTFFPDWSGAEWSEISRETHEPDQKNAYPYSFLELRR